MKHIEEILFTEKYRPKNIDDIVMPERIRQRFSNGLNHNVLLVSSVPGTGKTTTAKAIVEQFGHPYLYINASREGMDTLRDEVAEFCINNSLQTSKKTNQTKVVILDEIDGASLQFFKALRGAIEEYKHVRFIATCNYLSKVPEPLRDRRFEVINFEFTEADMPELRKGYAKKLIEVCKNENLKLVTSKNSDGVVVSPLTYLFDKYYPDMGSMLNVLQGIKNSGKIEITPDDIKASHSLYKSLFDLVFDLTSSEIVYKVIFEEYSNKIDSVLSSFANEFPAYIQKEKPEYGKYLPQFVIRLAYYQSMRSTIIDQILIPLALIYEFQEIIKK